MDAYGVMISHECDVKQTSTHLSCSFSFNFALSSCASRLEEIVKMVKSQESADLDIWWPAATVALALPRIFRKTAGVVQMRRRL